MKAVVLLFTLMGMAYCIPTGKSGYAAYTAPSHYRPAAYQAYAPAYAPSRAYYSSGPVVTGTLHHSQDTHGQYNFGYSSSDGQDKSETREGDGDVSGSYSYISPEGQKIQLAYKAGRGGFQAAGDHLPQAPEVPDLPEDLAEAYREAHGRLAQAYAESSQRGGPQAYDDGSYRKYSADGAYRAYSAGVSDSRYTAGYDDGAYKPTGDDGSYREQDISRYTQGYDDGSYKPSHSSSYRTYSTYTAPAPAFTTAYRGHGAGASGAYQTYSAPAAPSRAPYGAVSYSTNIGGVPVAAPAPASAPLAYAPATGIKKSSYAYHG